MQKRGLAPIYTTLIFLAVALSLGFVIMYISENTETALVCDYDVKLKFLEIGGVEEVCLEGSNLKFTLENGVAVDVEKLSLQFDVGPKQIIAASLTKGGIYTGLVAVDPAASEVTITPIINENGGEVSCESEALEISLSSC